MKTEILKVLFYAVLRLIVALLLIVWLLLIVETANGYYTSTQVDKPQVAQETNTTIPHIKSLVYITKADLMSDIMTNYQGVSKRTKREIVDTIFEESEKYKMNPLILYSLLHVESSMKPWTIHSEVIVSINKKKVKTRAIGIGAVIFEFWGAQLIEAKIIDNKSDLHDPVLNIRATAWIYNELYKLPRLEGTQYQDTSAMRRYFGGNFQSYSERIKSKIAELTLSKTLR